MGGRIVIKIDGFDGYLDYRYLLFCTRQKLIYFKFVSFTADGEHLINEIR